MSFSKIGKQWFEYGRPIKTSKSMKNKQIIPIKKYLLIQCRRIECTRNLLGIVANSQDR